MNQTAIDRQCEIYLEQINGWLAKRSRDALTQMMQLYLQEEFTRVYMPRHPDLVGGWILAAITYEELAAERQVWYAEQFDCLDSFFPVWNELKFCLWELEFLGGDQALKGMLEALQRTRMTDFSLKYLIQSSAVDKRRMLLTICEGLMLPGGDVRMALRLLARGCELFPEDQEIVGTWSHLMGVMGGEQCG